MIAALFLVLASSATGLLVPSLPSTIKHSPSHGRGPSISIAFPNAFPYEIPSSVSRRSISHRSTSLFASSFPAPSSSSTSPPSLLQKLTDPIYYPWNAAELADREARTLRREAAVLYRQIGVSEGSSYEEINEAHDALVKKYEGDIKMKMRVGVAKDKIMAIRLKQRVQGTLKIDAEARDMDMMSERIDQLNKSKRKFTPPAWMGGLMVMPDKAWTIKNAKFMGGTSLGCIFLPNMASSFIMLACMCSIGLLYSRGQPETVMDDMGMPGEVRPTSPIAVALTCGLCFGWAAIAAIVTSVVASALPKILPTNMVINLGVNLGFFIASTFFKTYKGDGSTGGKKKWGKNKN